MINIIKYLYKIYINESSGISIDSRTLVSGSIFFGLQGVNYNGAYFIHEALSKGAIIVVINHNFKRIINLDKFINKIIYVYDSLKILQFLSMYHRIQNQHVPLLAITGTNGKTTTKDLLVNIFMNNINIHFTVGNMNSHIGVPLTLLSRVDYNGIDLIILELGASKINDIDLLCKICKPDYGYITNFGYAHIQGFYTFENIVIEKTKLYFFLRRNEKLVFLNMDDNTQLLNSQDINSYSFSVLNKKADVYIKIISYYPYIVLSLNEDIIYTNILGIYNIYNICAAITIATYFNICIKKIQFSLKYFQANNNRSQLIFSNKKNNIFLDAYNANFTSIICSIKNFLYILDMNKKDNRYVRSLCIIGDMYELGDMEFFFHVSVLNFLVKSSINDVYLIGEKFYNINKYYCKIKYFFNLNILINFLTHYPVYNSFILIKGSRKLCLEKLVMYL